MTIQCTVLTHLIHLSVYKYKSIYVKAPLDTIFLDILTLNKIQCPGDNSNKICNYRY